MAVANTIAYYDTATIAAIIFLESAQEKKARVLFYPYLKFQFELTTLANDKHSSLVFLQHFKRKSFITLTPGADLIWKFLSK